MLDVEKAIEDNIGLAYNILHKHNVGFNEDAISYAMEALWRAALSFDETRGHAFSTYASTCVYNSIMRYFRDSMRNNKLECVSIDAELNDDGFTMADVIVDTEGISSEQLDIIMEAVYKALNKMNNTKHRSVIALWIDSNFEMRQIDIANELGITQAQVSRIFGSFRNKLKKELEVLL